MTAISAMGAIVGRRVTTGTVSSAGFSTNEDLYLNTSTGKSLIMTVAGGAARMTVNATSITVPSDVTLSVAGSLSVGTVSLGTLNAGLATITSGTVVTLGVSTLTASGASLTAGTIVSAVITGATLNTATIGTIIAASSTLTAASITSGTVVTLGVSTLTASGASLTAGTIVSAVVTGATLNTATIGTIIVASSTLTAASITSGTVVTLGVTTLTSSGASLTAGTIVAASITGATLNTATIGTVTAMLATLTTATIGNANVGTLSAAYGTITSASLGACWIQNDLTINGNLNVLGARNTVSAQELIVEDTQLTLGAKDTITGGSITAKNTGTISWRFTLPIGRTNPITEGAYIKILNAYASNGTSILYIFSYYAYKAYNVAFSSGVLTFDVYADINHGNYADADVGSTGDVSLLQTEASLITAGVGINVKMKKSETADLIGESSTGLGYGVAGRWDLYGTTFPDFTPVNLNLIDGSGTSAGASFYSAGEFGIARKQSMGIIYSTSSTADSDGLFPYRANATMTTVTNGDWRFVKDSSDNLLIQYYNNGWVTKGMVTT